MNKRQNQVKPCSECDGMTVNEESPYTKVEIRIARLCVEGLSDTQIAHVLDMSVVRVRALKDIITAKARAVNRGC